MESKSRPVCKSTNQEWEQWHEVWMSTLLHHLSLYVCCFQESPGKHGFNYSISCSLSGSGSTGKGLLSFWTVPIRHRLKLSSVSKLEASPKVAADAQSGSQSHQPMILSTGTHLRFCTVECRQLAYSLE